VPSKCPSLLLLLTERILGLKEMEHCSFKMGTFPLLVIMIVFAFSIPTSTTAQEDSCVTKPTMANCTGFILSQVEGDIDTLCSSQGMPSMGGCTVNRLCTEDRKRIKGQKEYCIDFSILKDLCLDMPMTGCGRYESMCANGSVVEECKMKSLPLPNTMMLSNLVTDMCNLMPMGDCSKCMSSVGVGKMLNCDLLQVYSDLCLSMPTMANCTQWKSLCRVIPDWPLCSGANSDQPPEMRMFFHVGILDYILFKDWVPRSNAQYAGSWLGIFFFTVMCEFFKLWRSNLEKKWAEVPDDDEGVPLVTQPPAGFSKFLSFGDPSGNTKFRASVDIPRALMQCTEVAWSFLIMLVVMTYNVGLFFAVICGVFVGSLLTGRFLSYKPKASCH